MLVSAIEHYSYCPRQCGLIHLESIFDENPFTLKGRHLHERADEPSARAEKGVRVIRAMPIWSDEYGLLGKADVVELHGDTAMPVEYKVGRDVGAMHAVYQAVAQGLCVREMLGRRVGSVAIYYGKQHGRTMYELTDELIAETLRIVGEIREMQKAVSMPPPVADKRCPKCSLIDACQPFAVLGASATDRRALFRPMRHLAALPGPASYSTRYTSERRKRGSSSTTRRRS